MQYLGINRVGEQMDLKRSEKQLEIRPMRPSEASTVAYLHREGIPQGFLSSLGEGFRSVMYEGIATATDSGVWVAVNDSGEVLGFISGTLHVGSCYKSVLSRRWFTMGLRVLPALVSPAAWRHVYETLTYPNKKSEQADSRDPEPTAELLSLAVTPRARGTGAAIRLCNALEDGMKEWGLCTPYRVVTMAADPRSNAFYRKVGFRFIQEFLHHGIAMSLYHKDIS